tara:strand:- start:4042 stop:4836 length:795 start_codon:yes stop_codon:yes gene_type:complete
MSGEKKQKVLVLGGTGYVGSNLLVKCFDETDMEAVAVGREFHVTRKIDEYDVIVNCCGIASLQSCGSRNALDDAYRANVAIPLQIRERYDGDFVHMSSAFAVFDPHLSRYGKLKQVADKGLAELEKQGHPKTLVVYPGWLYGGLNDAKTLPSFIESNGGLDIFKTIDNVKTANPTRMDWFASTVVNMIRHRFTGPHAVYERPVMTAAQLLEHLGIWGKHWSKGFYEDAVPRPLDWSYNDKLPHFTHVTPETCKLLFSETLTAAK